MHKTQDQHICRHYKQWQHCHICDLEAQVAELKAAQEPVNLEAIAAKKFIAVEERKVGERYGYVPKLHPSEWMDESAQEPVAWVGLTDAETQAYWDWEDWQTGAGRSTIFEMVKDIEAKLKERNT